MSEGWHGGHEQILNGGQNGLQERFAYLRSLLFGLNNLYINLVNFSLADSFSSSVKNYVCGKTIAGTAIWFIN